MIKASETRGRLADSTSSSVSPVSLARNIASYGLIKRFLTCVEIAGSALVRRRVLSLIGPSPMVWLASVWLAAGIAQAQNLPANDPAPSASEPAIQQRSTEKTQAPRLLLSMVDRSDLEPARSRPSAPIQPINPPSTDASCRTMKKVPAGDLFASLTAPSIASIRSIGPKQDAKDVGLASNPRGAEFRSLAALASTPSPSLLNAIPKNGLPNSDRPDTKSARNGSGMPVYQFGSTSFVVNELPFSVSSLGRSLPDAR